MISPKNKKTDSERRYTKMPVSKRILYDEKACIGCGSCQIACSSIHYSQTSPSLSAIGLKTDFENRIYTASVCRQCFSASCVVACPKDAIGFDEETNARFVDKDKCISCGACIKLCPFTPEEPVIHFAEVDGSKVLVKCDLCHGLEGGPACASVCPTGALKVGR